MLSTGWSHRSFKLSLPQLIVMSNRRALRGFLRATCASLKLHLNDSQGVAHYGLQSITKNTVARTNLCTTYFSTHLRASRAKAKCAGDQLQRGDPCQLCLLRMCQGYASVTLCIGAIATIATVRSRAQASNAACVVSACNCAAHLCITLAAILRQTTDELAQYLERFPGCRVFITC